MRSGPRTALTLELTAIAAALLMLGQPAAAQTTEPPKPGNGLERAQKAADAVFHWIKLNGDKGASRQPTNAPPAPPPPPPPAPAPVARKPAAPVAAAPKPATPAAQAPVQAAAAPVTAAAQPEVEPPPVLVAAAAPTPAPAAPIPTAVAAVEPPPPPVEEEEAPLKLLSKVNPSIPRQMQQTAFRDGFARVKFTVAPNGTVSKAETIAASHSRLGISAIEAVRQWRFEPIKAPREVAIEFAFNNTED